MKEILATERLILTEWELPDAAFLLKLVNTPQWIEFIGDRNIHSIQDAEQYIKKLRLPYGSYGYGFYGLRLKDSKELIGLCGIIKRMGLNDPDLGFALLPEHEGQGYMYEVSTALLKHAFVKLGISRVVAITTEQNSRSIKLLERLGMKYEKDVKLPKEEKQLRLFAYERKN